MSGPTKDNRTWYKSSRSSPSGHCVEVAVEPELVLVRDSKNRIAGTLHFGGDRWRDFIAGVQTGEFDRPGA
jgi:Domain of unknown function (DUF397)